jgi:hypothetical protein
VAEFLKALKLVPYGIPFQTLDPEYSVFYQWIRIQDPEYIVFLPVDPDPGSVIYFFQIPDPIQVFPIFQLKILPRTGILNPGCKKKSGSWFIILDPQHC